MVRSVIFKGDHAALVQGKVMKHGGHPEIQCFG